MVALIVLVHDEEGNMHDLEDHLRNAVGQKIDDKGALILNQLLKLRILWLM